MFDPQQRPVDGAVVSLHTLAGAALQRTTTGADGRFNFALVPEGEYIVQYASHRFSRQTATTIVPTVTGSYDLSFV